jgi:transposase-like protein
VTQQERSRKARAKWQRLVSEQGRSGQSVAAFCREHRLCIPHFYWWKKRLQETAPAKPAGIGRFVEVKVATAAPEASTPSEGRVEIRLRNGRSLVVGQGCDAEQVRVLVGVVEAA